MIINGNNIEELKKFDDNYFDSIVTDPPYEIGFMGKSWDASGIANNSEMWSECLRVLKPGGYLLSFSATRTYHRMAVAIEDAGFEIRDMIEWVYGSGFPKSLNVGKAVARLQGKDIPKTKGFNVAGQGTALKPAHEPICMARKPLAEKTVAENCLKYGTGGINIDESRVGFLENEPYQLEGKVRPNKSDDIKWQGAPQIQGWKPSTGRFPANLIHDNSEEVRECFPETHSSGNYTRKTKALDSWFGGTGNIGDVKEDFDNGGNASRFFKSIIYQAKASKSERNKGCEGLEKKHRILSNQAKAELKRGNDGYKEENGKLQMGGRIPQQNNHPTVKPIALMEYLIKMVTPKGGIVLDPFMGSGSTGVACVLNDFEFVGIDLDKDYCEIARARIEGVKETQTKMF